ncbi:jg15094 [Pararge aegeria aegeria]|uniref:Jg15094 protein n=1 Tax=Pararge aegeria aegeria TaxID=348720 RepID=A0A8S4QMM4_9NEOP|nr:jg15094 [Pararge aegeria aegeria]
MNRIERFQKKFLRHLAYKENILKKVSTYAVLLNVYKALSLSDRRDFIDLSFLKSKQKNRRRDRLLKSDEQGAIGGTKHNARSHIMNKLTLIPRIATSNLGRSAPLCRIVVTYNKLVGSAGLDIFRHSAPCFKNEVKKLLKLTDAEFASQAVAAQRRASAASARGAAGGGRDKENPATKWLSTDFSIPFRLALRFSGSSLTPTTEAALSQDSSIPAMKPEPSHGALARSPAPPSAQ